MKMNKKGMIENLQALIVPLVAIGIVITIGFLIIAEARDQVIDTQGLDSKGTSTTHPNGSAAWNASGDVVDAMADIPTWLPIIVITVIGALLIGLVAAFRGK